MVKNPNWQDTDQLAIYKSGREVELGASPSWQLQLVSGQSGTWLPGTSGFQERRPNRSTMLLTEEQAEKQPFA